jgi:hypothetical protein
MSSFAVEIGLGGSHLLGADQSGEMVMKFEEVVRSAIDPHGRVLPDYLKQADDDGHDPRRAQLRSR